MAPKLVQLPQDVHDIIARDLHLSVNCDTHDNEHSLLDDKYLKAFLVYAKTGVSQRRAVMRAIGRHLYPTYLWSTTTILDWISLSANHIWELSISEATRFSFDRESPRFPNLRKASINSLPEQVSLIHGSPKLTELFVLILHTGGWDRIVSAIGSLPLKTLSLLFQLQAKTRLKRLSKIELMSLSAACPAVEKFSLDSEGMTPAAWDMLKGLRSLKCLAIRGGIKDEYFPFLETVPEIEIYDSLRIEEALRLRSHITGFDIYVSSREKILELACLSRLRKLEILLHQNHEGALVGVVDNIEELSLSWLYVNKSHNLEGFIGDISLLKYPKYCEPDPNVLENIMSSACRLKSLTIKRAILKSEVIERLLEIASDKLEKLQICHDWQVERVSNRMERVLEAIAMYCPKLKILRFLEKRRNCFFILATDEEKQRCHRALNELVKSVPRFESYRTVRFIIEHRFTSERHQNMLLWNDIIAHP